jgi:hypothetical protein
MKKGIYLARFTNTCEVADTRNAASKDNGNGITVYRPIAALVTSYTAVNAMLNNDYSHGINSCM